MCVRVFVRSSWLLGAYILSQICSVVSGVFTGTALPNCQFMAADIKECQSKGKIITLSVGGATGAASFASDSEATAFVSHPSFVSYRQVLMLAPPG